MTLTIFGIARSRAVRNLWMAGELGLDYRHEPVEFGDKGSGLPSFRALNPMGQVPVIDDDGVVLSESLAINLFLVKKYGGPLAPKDLAEEGQMLRWTLFAATQIEPQGVVVMLNRFGKPPTERDEAAALKALDTLKRPLSALDSALASGFLVGGRFTVADLNVACCLFYLRFAPEAIALYSNVQRAWNAVTQRPAFKAAMALRGE